MSEVDPQVRKLLDQVDEMGIPPFHALSVESARDMYETINAPPDEPEPVADVADHAFETPHGEVPIRVYTPEGEGPFPAIVFLHGGGWILGNLDTSDGTCRTLANEVGAIVISVDYRLGPEHPFPAGVEDAYAAVEWTAKYGDSVGVDTSRIAVAGSSSGGNLAAAVALMARDRDGPDLAHQLLFYPVLNHPAIAKMESYQENARGYLLEFEDLEYFYDHYIQRDADVRNPYAFPLQMRDLSDVASATVITAEFDPLRDEGVAYAERLADAGVAVDSKTYEGMIHGFVGKSDQLDGGLEGLNHGVSRLQKAFNE